MRGRSDKSGAVAQRWPLGPLALKLSWQGLRQKKYDNAIIMVITLATVVCIKLFYSNAEAEELRWVLSPTTLLVELFSGIDFYFAPQKGYVAAGSSVVIGPGCAGLNFYAISLSMTVFSFIDRFDRHKPYWFLLFVVITFLLTVCVNTFRILGGMLLLQTSHFFAFAGTEVAHSAQGTLFFVFFLVLYFSAVRMVLAKRGEA